MENEELLVIKNLTIVYTIEEGIVKAVDDIDITLNKGETLGLVGESGCGKSTLALSVLRLIPSHSGEITGGKISFKGVDLLSLDLEEMRKKRGKEIAIVFQDPTSCLNPLFTIGDQIEEAIRLHQNLDKKKTRTATIDILRKVGIADPVKMLKHYPHEFSGGMRQRAMIAMALSCRPELLILDEPTSSLDVTIQAQILSLVDKLKEDFGSSIILITHNLGVIAEAAEKVAVMYSGKIVEYGTVTQIFEESKHPYTQLLLSAIPRLDIDVKRLAVIGGVVPSLINPPSGCRFHPRCPYQMSDCKKIEPELIEVDEGHLVACHMVV